MRRIYSFFCTRRFVKFSSSYFFCARARAFLPFFVWLYFSWCLFFIYSPLEVEFSSENFFGFAVMNLFLHLFFYGRGLAIVPILGSIADGFVYVYIYNHFCGTPSWTRTSNSLLRRQMLCPVELSGQFLIFVFDNIY